MSWFKTSTFFEKICALAFLCFAVISCITTAHSLTLTFGLSFAPDWAVFTVMFIIAFFVYVLTSYCFKQMIDSNSDAYCASIHKTVADRRKMFWLGLLGVTFFWLAISLPTNIHSMLYVKEAGKVASAELGTQKEVLETEYNLTDQSIISAFHKDSTELVKKVGDLREKFAAEVNHRSRPGLGDSAKYILNSIEIACNSRSVGSVFITSGVQNLSPKDIVDYYDPQIVSLRDRTLEEIKGNYIKRLNPTYKAKLDSLIKTINKTQNGLNETTITVSDARKTINNIYNFNDTLKVAVWDKMEVLQNEEDGHIPENVKHYNNYRTERLYNVYHVVVEDFFKGLLPFDMLYLILFAALLDIAALVFSGIAFRGQVNNNANNNFLKH